MISMSFDTRYRSAVEPNMERISSSTHGPGKKFSIYIDSYFDEDDDVIEKDIPEILDYSNSGSEITSNSSLRVKSAPLLSISSVHRRKHREYCDSKEQRQEENYTVTGSGSTFNFVYSTTTYCSSSDSTDSDISTLSSCSEIISINNNAATVNGSVSAETFEPAKKIDDDVEAPNEPNLNYEPETSVDSDPESENTTVSTDKDFCNRSPVVSSSSSGDDRTYLISRNVYTAIPEQFLYFDKPFTAVDKDRSRNAEPARQDACFRLAELSNDTSSGTDDGHCTVNTGYVEYVFSGRNQSLSSTDGNSTTDIDPTQSADLEHYASDTNGGTSVTESDDSNSTRVNNSHVGSTKLPSPGGTAADGNNKYEDVVQKVINNYRNVSISMKSKSPVDNASSLAAIDADDDNKITSRRRRPPLEILEPPEPFKDGQPISRGLNKTGSKTDKAESWSSVPVSANVAVEIGSVDDNDAATVTRCWIVDKTESSAADNESAACLASPVTGTSVGEALVVADSAAGRHYSLGRLSNDAWKAVRSDEQWAQADGGAMLLGYLNYVEPKLNSSSCCSLGADQGREVCRRLSLLRDLRLRSAKAHAGHDNDETDTGNPCRFKRCSDADWIRSLSFSEDIVPFDRESVALFRVDVDGSEENYFDSRSRPSVLFCCSKCASDVDNRFKRSTSLPNSDGDGDCSGPDRGTTLSRSRLEEQLSVDEMKSKSPKNGQSEPQQSAAEPDKKAMVGGGILKSALKRSGSSGSAKKSSSQKKKHRVQFNESLNKSFEADYVILVRDDDYEEEDDFVGCDCGSQFCYDSCYYLDEDNGEFDPKCQHLETTPMVQLNHRFLVDTSRFDDCPLSTAGTGPPFEPPFEFVDHVTLSPPDGYKDGCSNSDPLCSGFTVNTSTMTTPQDDDPPLPPKSSSEKEPSSLSEIKPSLVSSGTEKTDKKDETNYKNNKTGDNSTSCDLNVKIEAGSSSKQLTVVSEPSAVSTESESNEEIVGAATMTKVTERRQMLEAENLTTPSADSNANNGGILKGGKLWKNCADREELAGVKAEPELTLSPLSNDKRCVKFSGNEQQLQSRLNDACNCATDNSSVEERCAPPSNMEYTLTFRLGNRIVPTNSLKPNSAVRQLFPDSKFVPPPSCWDEDGLGKCEGKYLVTEESLRAFNEVNRRSVFSSLKGKEVYPYKGSNSIAENDQEEDLSLQSDLLKKTIERGTLRRSLMRSSGRRRADRSSSGLDSNNISLEERIKQLTMVDDQEVGEETNDGRDEPSHGVPECRHQELQQHSAANATSDNHRSAGSNHGAIVKGSVLVKPVAKSSASGGSMYRKFADLFSRKTTEITVSTTTEQHYPYYQPMQQSAADKTTANEARKQFLSTLTPLKTCVAAGNNDDLANRDLLKLPFNRNSIVSTVSSAGTEYSLSDIDEVLRANGSIPSATSTEAKATEPPDVLAGTPNGASGNVDNSQDELAMFVQQDASRIERIRKRYSVTPSSAAESEDDEHDDYGFSRRPSVKGIKPRFGSTTEILQQIQQQLQPPPLACAAKAGSHMTWPYYSAECADARTSATKNLLPTVREEDRSSLVGKANFAPECAARLTWETLPPGRRLQPISPVLPGQDQAHSQFGAAPYASRVALGASSANSYLQMKVSPLPVSQVRIPFVSGSAALDEQPQRGVSPTTTSIIRVGHGQQQTFRLPCPVSGPVQVHLFHCGTSGVDNKAAAQFRTNSSSLPTDSATSAHHLHRHHHHHHHQLVIARGTQTAALTHQADGYNSNGHYQNAVVSLLNGPVTAAAVAGVGAIKNCPPATFIGNSSTATSKAAHLAAYPSGGSHQPSPVPSMTSSPTRMKLCGSSGAAYSQLAVERGIPEGASCSPAFPRDSPVPLVNIAASSNLLPPKKTIVDSGSSQAAIVAGTKSSPLPSSFGMKV